MSRLQPWSPWDQGSHPALLSSSPCPAVRAERGHWKSENWDQNVLYTACPSFPQLGPFSPLPKPVPWASSPGGLPCSQLLTDLLNPGSPPRMCPQLAPPPQGPWAPLWVLKRGPFCSMRGGREEPRDPETPREGKKASEVCEQGGGLGRPAKPGNPAKSRLQIHFPNLLGREQEAETGQQGGLGRLPLASPLLAWDPHQESLGKSARAGTADTPGRMLR